MIPRKFITAIITLILSVSIYSAISKGPISENISSYFFILTFAILCGTLMSIIISYFVRNRKFNSFALRLFLHIVIAVILPMIFVKEHYFQIMFYMSLPVSTCYFVIDELLRFNSNRS